MAAKETITIHGITFGIQREPDGTLPYIVCARPIDLGHEPPRKGSRLTVCAFCWTDVWCDPASKKYAPNAKTICLDCTLKLAKSTEKAQ